MALGIAVIGLDHWYTAFGVCDTAAKSERAPLVGIAEADAARRAEAERRWPGAAVTDDYRALLAREDVGIVAICASTDQAPGIAKDALAAGKHVVSVKPPARTLEELDGVIAAAKAAGRFYGSFEGMQRLHSKAILLRQLLEEGAIGQPLTLRQVGHGGLPSPWPGQPGGADSWWLHAEKVPGGAWIDHAIYTVDLARFAFGGEVDLPTVAGVVGRRIHPDLALEDYGAALMRLQRPGGGGNGPAADVTLFIEDTWAAKDGGGAHSFDIMGTAGNLRFDGGANAWIVTRGGAEPAAHPVPDSPFFNLDALANGLAASPTSLPFGPADARANLAACLRFYAAAAR